MKQNAFTLILTLAILAISPTTVAQPTPQEQASQATRHDENGEDKQSDLSRITPSESKKNIPLQTPPAEEGKKRIPEDPPKIDWWSRISNAVMAIGTLALAVIGAIAASIAIRTLRSIETQTNHAGIAADAAKASVDAIIAENRPWLLIPLENGIQSPFLDAVEHGTQRLSHCVFKVKNYGKTPGKITAWNAQLQIGDSAANPPNIGIYKDMEGATINPQIVPQGQRIFQEATLTPDGFIRLEKREDVLTRHIRFLWLCGFIKYNDTFERKKILEYETVFCLLYETRTNAPVPYWRLAGPDEYNKAT
jgi:hypothetical protein